ncbi:hypothetical protein [Deinococcus koreensis]|uniref:Uncharacterized protein n=1 Tax=Deinococcus koreensis TaxID=2054903 RepID=A0A2K3UXX7_9DEIO|nr:hypothetical protein [Deinococcus koreensis]PNY81391.1 hypothetical protein CVO96_08340 [Deinococcus koreensis]
MPFTSRELGLLSQNCYGATDLPEWLERMRLEGPGDYGWPPAPGHYAPEDTPLYERIFAQIWHQGDLYPATYIAVPVWCEVVARFPEISHARLLSLLSLIETFRPLFQPRLLGEGRIGQGEIAAYEQALSQLAGHLPRQLTLLSDSTVAGFREVESVLALLAFASGQCWAGTLLT